MNIPFNDTTGLACKTLNRHFIGIEKDEEYCDITVTRLEEDDKKTI